MPPGNSGINKPFDRILKSFLDEAPALFLRLLGVIPAGVEADIQPLRPETAPAVVLPDYVAAVRIGREDPFIFHGELQVNYYQDLPRNVARYGGSLAWQYQMQVRSVVMMLRRRGVPAKIPEIGTYSIGDTHTTHPFKVVRLWEIEPDLVLETNNPKLLPLAILLKSTDEQVRELASLFVRRGEEEALGRFLVLGTLRYNRSWLNEAIGERKMVTMREYLEAVGEVQGEIREATKVLRRCLRKKFPELESIAPIDKIPRLETIEALIDTVFDTNDADTVRTAILAATEFSTLPD